MPRDVINPLLLVVAKQPVGQEDADQIALPVLVHFDAAKRGQCTAEGCNHLTTHLIIAAHIAAGTKSKTFYETVQRAYACLMKAAARKTKLLDLSTTEYTALRAAFGMYIRALPGLEIARLTAACKHAVAVMAA